MADQATRLPRTLETLEARIPNCRRCPELRAYCAEVAARKRRAFQDETYWGRPVPGFGDAAAMIFLVGLAPAAHGANRTGRMFTGDNSGHFLYAALHRTGFANQPEATHREDGLALRGIYIGATLRCAPPANKPTPTQRANCAPFLRREFQIIKPRVVVCLGGISWQAAMSMLTDEGLPVPRPRPKFGHAVEVELPEMTVVGCYHVSQQNTFTGRLTEKMIDDVLLRARTLAARP